MFESRRRHQSSPRIGEACRAEALSRRRAEPRGYDLASHLSCKRETLSVGPLSVLPTERMSGQRAIKRHQLQTFNAALSEQKPVERIARRRFRIDVGEHVWRFDR